MGELLFTLFMLIIFGIFYHGAGDIQTTRSVDPIGPVPVPEVVIFLGAILCVVLLVLQARRLLSGQAKKGGKFSIKTLALILLLVVFLLLLDTVGFYLSAVLLIFVLSRMLGNASYPRCAATAVASATVFALLFGKVLSVPLPRGDGMFRVLSHWLF